jgi:hypothetical protein
MKNNSLAATNKHLNRVDAGDQLAINLATSTAVETGKPAALYVERYHATHKAITVPNSSGSRKKSSA